MEVGSLNKPVRANDTALECKIITFRTLLQWRPSLRWLSRGGKLAETLCSQDPPGHRRCGVPECRDLPGNTVGKPAANSEPKSGLSNRGCHIQRTMAQSSHGSWSRGPESGKNDKTPTPAPCWEERHKSVPQEITGFGDSKRGYVPETETPSHRPDDHQRQPETRETGMTDC